jgi:hypothetical protein
MGLFRIKLVWKERERIADEVIQNRAKQAYHFASFMEKFRGW